MVQRKFRRSVGLLPFVLTAADSAFELRALFPQRTAAFAALYAADRPLEPSDAVFAAAA